MVFNVYHYINNNFHPDDHVHVDIKSSDLTLGGVTSALVRVSHADPSFILDCMESVIQSNRAVSVDSGDIKKCYAVAIEAKLGNISKGISLSALSKLAASRAFRDYKIIVYSTKNYNLPQAVENEFMGWKGSIYLLLDDTAHFCLITRLNAFFGKEGYYCQTCYKFFTGVSASHICYATLCKQCKMAFYSGSEASDVIQCTHCKHSFYSEVCYHRHL